MTTKRQIEIFTAGCFCCSDAVNLVEQLACSSCEVSVYNLAESHEGDEVRQKATEYGVERVPSIVVDGTLARCCDSDEVDRQVLEKLGVGQSV